MNKKFRDESGQSLVLVALAISVILGCAGLAIDSGRVHNEQIKVQNATDCAAMAAVKGIPTYSIAKSIAEEYADKNCDDLSVSVAYPYEGNAGQVCVTCTKNVPYTFARVLGFEGTSVQATAVAEKISGWDGEALPFLNWNDNYENPGDQLVAWDKNAQGFFESIWKHNQEGAAVPEIQYFSTPTPHFKVAYEDGICVEKGKDSSIKTELETMFRYYENKPIYLFSLRSDLIKSGTATPDNKGKIDVKNIVLLKVQWNKLVSNGNESGCYVTYLGEYYNVEDIVNGTVKPENLGGESSLGGAKLVG